MVRINLQTTEALDDIARRLAELLGKEANMNYTRADAYRIALLLLAKKKGVA